MRFHPAIYALNHLLAQNSWAPSRLARFAGKTLRVEIATLAFCYTILENGLLLVADDNALPDARCVISPSLLPRLALRDESAYHEIKSSGDAALLAEIFFLSRNLVWDSADDVSRVTGDMAAERIVAAAKHGQQQLRGAVLNFSQAMAEYLTDENPLLAKPQQVTAFMRQVDDIRDDIARLEQRISRLLAANKI